MHVGSVMYCLLWQFILVRKDGREAEDKCLRLWLQRILENWKFFKHLQHALFSFLYSLSGHSSYSPLRHPGARIDSFVSDYVAQEYCSKWLVSPLKTHKLNSTKAVHCYIRCIVKKGVF